MQKKAYKHYLLLVLTVILGFNWLDRVALGIVLDDIKADLHLTDTELGLLGGIAFALFYSVMGIPIARWADRGNRVTIISVTVALWSGAVALCGAAVNFVQLMLIRVGVAVGEAGCCPPALSMINQAFNRGERPWAAAIYGSGSAFATVIGYLLAGWLNELYGWRMTFVLLGAPGLVLAALAWVTLKEPRRMPVAQPLAADGTSQTAALRAVEPSMKEVAVTLWGNLTFRHLLYCFAVNYFFGYGLFQWLPPFFMRSFGFSSGQVGTWFALVSGIMSIGGTYLCAELALRYAARNEKLQLRGMAVAIVISTLGLIGTFLASNAYAALALFGLVNFFQAALNGPLVSTIQTVVPERMCAVAFALVYMIANLIGMGFGPLAAGALSDAARPWVGDESLRCALLIMSPGYFWVAWHAWRASQTVANDIPAAQIVENDDVKARVVGR